MIEKIMKAVKRGNKKRSRNITIGTVIGFLLSCTAVMGAIDGNYLFIKDDGGIKFSTDGNAWDNTNPYEDVGNTWGENTYINNTILLANGADVSVYGVKLELNSPDFKFINNGIINAQSNLKNAYGIYIVNGGKIGNIENNGVINAYSGTTKWAYGIHIDSSEVESIENNGIITGSSDEELTIGISSKGLITKIINKGVIDNKKRGTGILNSLGKVEKIINIGEISSSNVTKSKFAYGIRVANEVREVINTGSIKAFGAQSSQGITSTNSSSKNQIDNILNIGTISSFDSIIAYGIVSNVNATIEKIVNTGVVYGQTSAIYLSGTIGNGGINNYGILTTGGSIIQNYGVMTGTENNYGMYIGKDGKITVDSTKTSDAPIEIVVGYDKDGNEVTKYMTIRNATLNGTSGEATSTESFEFKGEVGKYNNSILNGKDKTLNVLEGKNQITDSIINAYQTAVVMEGTKSSLVLNNTVVNGGAAKDKEVPTIEIGGEDNAFTLKGESIVNTGARDNVAITVGGKDNALVLEGNAKVNGEMKSTGTNNLISLNGNAGNGMNILHNISGFTNMNIDNNVTFFENVEVTGAEKITIGANGVLTLRINSINKNQDNKIIGHALYGNTGEISSIGDGKLLFALNGAGNESIISFGNTTLGDGLVTGNEGTLDTTSQLHTIFKISDNEVKITVRIDIPEILKYKELNKIYHGILSVEDLIANFNVNSNESLSVFLGYLNDVYAGNPYSYSSELSRKSVGMFRDIATENQFKPELNKWLIMGGLTHVDGGTKDTYYGKGYYTYDIGSSDMDADTKITGAYMLGEYGVSDTLTYGVVIGGNKLKSDLSNGSKVDGDALYMGAYAKKYVGNLKVTGGLGLQYGDYDADRFAAGRGITETRSYSDNYNDMTYDIYLNGRYSHNIGENLFLEPYGTLSYTYIKQDSADEGNKVLAIETDSKTFDYTAAKVGVDLKKVIPHEKGKSTLSAGVSYTRLLTGADEENITGRFKGGSDFDILVAHKNEHSIGLNAKYTLELENGILFDVKGSYSVERDSHNGSGKNRAKGEWIVGAGIGYKF